MPESAKSVASRLWTNVDQNTDAALNYLELLTSLMEDIKRRVTGKLGLVPGQRVLEIGCGTGRDAEYLAELVAPGGKAIATDLSAELIARATDRVANLGLPLEYQVADAQNLPFSDASFDAARVERMLQHVPDPGRAVREMVRVVRPGGRIVAFEPDWETMSVSGGNVAVLRALRRYRVDVLNAHAGIGRDTPHLFRRAGCTAIEAEGIVLGMRGLSVAETTLGLRECVDGAISRGWISDVDAHAWREAVAARDAEGSFYASISGTIVSATVA